MAAVVSWRLGRDAELPRAWWQDNCLVTEGTWADTDHSQPSHGKMTFHGAADGDHEMEYHRLESGFEAEPDSWGPGSALSIDAEGGSLPGFHLGSTVAPELELTTWDLPAVQPGDLTLSRAEPLELKWVPGSGEAFFLILQARDDEYESFFHTAWCHFPAETGAATVPLAVLQTLVGQDDLKYSNIYFGSLARDTTHVDSTDIEWWNWYGRAAQVKWR